MNSREWKILFVALAAFLILSGCSNSQLSKERVLQAKEFLEKHLDAEFWANYFGENNFENLQYHAPQQCKNMPKKDYWKATLTEGNATLTLYLDRTTLEPECIAEEGSSPTPAPTPTSTATPQYTPPN